MRKALVLTSLCASLLAAMAIDGGSAASKFKPKASQAGGPQKIAVDNKASAASKPKPKAPPVAMPQDTAVKQATAVEPPTPATPEQDRMAAQSRLGFGLIQELSRAPNPPGNIIVSPAGLASPLALLDLGASAPMRAAIHRTLGLDGKPGADPAADLDALRMALAGLSKPEEGAPLAFASAVVFDPASKPFPLAVLGLKAAGAEVSTEDLGDPKTGEVYEREDRNRGPLGS